MHIPASHMHSFHWFHCSCPHMSPCLQYVNLVVGRGVLKHSPPVITLVTYFSQLLPNHGAITGHLMNPSIGIRNENRRVQFGSANSYALSVLWWVLGCRVITCWVARSSGSNNVSHCPSDFALLLFLSVQTPRPLGLVLYLSSLCASGIIFLFKHRQHPIPRCLGIQFVTDVSTKVSELSKKSYKYLTFSKLLDHKQHENNKINPIFGSKRNPLVSWLFFKYLLLILLLHFPPSTPPLPCPQPSSILPPPLVHVHGLYM